MSFQKKTDILVIGSGLAGLFFTYNISKRSKYKVTVVTKRSIYDTNTRHAQGGIASVLSTTDSFEEHIKDTIVAGDYLCREDVVDEIIKEGPHCIKKLQEIGVKFNLTKVGEIELGREGGHNQRRIAHVKDTTGRAIQNQLVDVIKTIENVEVLEFHSAIDLVHIDSQVAGAYVFDIKQDKTYSFSAKLTVLATGGAGKVFLYTSNPDTASGDGIAMAFRAGATVANMEFVQFHPTLWWNPNYKNFLITEALRGEGATLKTKDGDRFMSDIHELAELAPRDIVARAIDSIMKKTGDDFVYLDITDEGEKFIKNRFPGIYEKLMEYGTDMTKTSIPVVPAAHYTIGGIRAEVNGNTNVKGLLAIGETAYTGLHGANRLASNSLLEAAVMAEKASINAIEMLDNDLLKHYSFPEWETGDAVDSDEAVIISHNWDELRRLMWNFVGIVRTNKRLLRAKHRIKLLKDEVLEYYWKFHITPNILELRNVVQIAELIVDSALARKESRGSHYNTDYPDKQKEKRDVLIQRRFGVFYSDVIE